MKKGDSNAGIRGHFPLFHHARLAAGARVISHVVQFSAPGYARATIEVSGGEHRAEGGFDRIPGDTSQPSTSPAANTAGVANDTLVLFLSGNGGAPAHGSDNGPLRGSEGTTYEGGIRVPAGPPREANLSGFLRSPAFSRHWCAPMAKKPLDALDLWPQLSGGTIVAREPLFFGVNTGLPVCSAAWGMEPDPNRGAGQVRRGRVFVPLAVRSGGGQGRPRCQSSQGAGVGRRVGSMIDTPSGRRQYRRPLRLDTIASCTKISALR